MWVGVFFLFIMNFVKPILQPLIRKKYVISNKTGLQTTFDRPHEVITLSPGGFYGFYMMGICTYLKEHYDTSDHLFSGASAGAWNALYMTLRTDPTCLKYALLQRDHRRRQILDVQREMKDRILQQYTKHDFDLERLCISVVTVGQTNIYTEFEHLEDAIDCCIASSHIPWVTTRSMMHIYRNQCVFDGGFSNTPYVDTHPSSLHISPNMWGQNPDTRYHMFKQGTFDLNVLFQNGYRDTLLYGSSLLNRSLNHK